MKKNVSQFCPILRVVVAGWSPHPSQTRLQVTHNSGILLQPPFLILTNKKNFYFYFDFYFYFTKGKGLCGS